MIIQIGIVIIIVLMIVSLIRINHRDADEMIDNES